LRADGRRHTAAPGSRLDLTNGSGEQRDDIAAVAGASLLPRGATASAGRALAWSGEGLVRWKAGTRWPRQRAAQPRGAGENTTGHRPGALNAEPACGSPNDRRRQAPAGR